MALGQHPLERPKAWQGWARSTGAGLAMESGNSTDGIRTALERPKAWQGWARSTGAGLAMESGNSTDGIRAAPI